MKLVHQHLSVRYKFKVKEDSKKQNKETEQKKRINENEDVFGPSRGGELLSVNLSEQGNSKWVRCNTM